MTVMHLDPESLAGRVIAHLKEGEGHPMRTDLIARAFDVSPRVVHTQLADVVAHMVLKREKDHEDEYTYRRGPQFKMAMLDGKPEPVIAARHLQAPAAAAPAPAEPTRPISLERLTPDMFGVRKGVPMPGPRVAHGLDWTPLLERLTDVGDSTDPMPASVRQTLRRNIKILEGRKGKDGPRFEVRSINKDNVAVWRVA
ncbi:hypothetical protein PMI14_05844 [Acidovorax sp. CF316]|uniref:hypothetical protein n=1 Tax=Acidovorax sp. CF316 TaxID=1144317 RepID=UPI00026BC804|nr:hypothetical protein [Acidovorax sp. CF316]EJE49601.1 hypothetical protein PMI14_05844 [Acidovorax sp. CF316]